MKRKYFITLMIMGMTTFFLSSCLTSFVSSPHDINKVSKQLSISERATTVIEVVPQSSKTVYKTVRDYLNSKKNHSVIRYKYNRPLKQYTHYDWGFMFFPPNRQKGAYVAVQRNLLAGRTSQLTMIMVYITPTEEGETEIKVFQKNPGSYNKQKVSSSNQNKKTDKEKSVLNDIINRLPAPPQSQFNKPAATIEIDANIQQDITNESTTDEKIEEDETDSAGAL